MRGIERWSNFRAVPLVSCSEILELIKGTDYNTAQADRLSVCTPAA